MEFGLWSTLLLIVLVFMALAALCGLQVPLSRRRVFWPGLVQPAVWLVLGLLAQVTAPLPEERESVPGVGAWIMLGITLLIWGIVRLRRLQSKKEN